MGATSTFSHEKQSYEHAMTDTAMQEQTAWGIAGNEASAPRTVTVTMNDNMRFTPDKLTFKQGETVRFIIRNQGQLPHELVMGTRKSLVAHAAMMAQSPAMAHDEPSMAHVDAGKKSELIWTFNRSGEFDFACLATGHYEAGMSGKISVASASR